MLWAQLTKRYVDDFFCNKLNNSAISLEPICINSSTKYSDYKLVKIQSENMFLLFSCFQLADVVDKVDHVRDKILGIASPVSMPLIEKQSHLKYSQKLTLYLTTGKSWSLSKVYNMWDVILPFIRFPWIKYSYFDISVSTRMGLSVGDDNAYRNVFYIITLLNCVYYSIRSTTGTSKRYAISLLLQKDVQQTRKVCWILYLSLEFLIIGRNAR